MSERGHDFERDHAAVGTTYDEVHEIDDLHDGNVIGHRCMSYERAHRSASRPRRASNDRTDISPMSGYSGLTE
jgi:hypothetical protein